MAKRLLQANINHCRAAQDVLLHSMAERGCGLGVVAEPYRVPPNHPCWAVDRCSLVAIRWRMTDDPVAYTRLEAGDGFVAVKWGHVTIVGVYVSSNTSVARYEAFLDDLWGCVSRMLPSPTIVAGDFNAKSALRGSPVTNAKGRLLERWATGFGLCTLNTGSVQTYVRHRGGFHRGHHVGESPRRATHQWVEGGRGGRDALGSSLYRDLYILSVIPPEVLARRREAESSFPRWALRKLDRDMFRAAVQTSLWVEDISLDILADVDEAANWIGDVMTAACDAGMPRSKLRPRAAYWWTEEIAELRRSSVYARRAWLRARRSRWPCRLEEAGEGYRSARRALSKTIKVAKDRSWNKLLQALDKDPWGRPYQMVLNKLRTWVPPVTETLDPEFNEEVVDTLFPDDPAERVDGSPTPPVVE
ncbi:uncharacterized protein [Temnothorax nylanderi]|uniref:uncharacterized protein n=1 Tax=Temnothorax nylanderi TaxID=102681 RepID=UPI003A8B3EF5